jgi:hypothetical protein
MIHSEIEARYYRERADKAIADVKALRYIVAQRMRADRPGNKTPPPVTDPQ